MKSHNDQIAEFNGRVIIHYENSWDPEFASKAWSKIKAKLPYMSFLDRPEFMLDDNGVVESGYLIYNTEADEWEAVFNK